MDFTYDSEMRIGRIGNSIIPSVTEIIKDFFPFPSGNMDLGRAVHIATEFYDKGTLDLSTVDDSIMTYLEAYRKFREETKFNPIRIEERLFHPSLMYHGQLDRVGTWSLTPGQIVIDIKKYRPTKSTALQLIAYDMLLPALSIPRLLYALELKDNGNYSLHEFARDSRDKDAFLAMLTLRNWKIQNG